jgi:hypothetical protein
MHSSNTPTSFVPVSLTRLRSVISWAAAWQFAIGLLLGATALFLVPPSAHTSNYFLFFVAILVPAGVLVLGKDLIKSRPRLGSLVLVLGAGFDALCFHQQSPDWDIGAIICLSFRLVGFLVLALLAAWWFKGRPAA